MGAPSDKIKVASAVINVAGQPNTAAVLADAIIDGLAGARVDLAILLASAHFEREIETIALEIEERLGPRAFIGTTGEAVIGGEFEYEGQPAVALWAAHLPGAHLSAFHLTQDDLDDLVDDADLAEQLGAAPGGNQHFILLADPFSFGRGIQTFLDRINTIYPGRPAIGGLASAGEQPGQNALLFEGQTLRQGLAGVAISGPVRIDTVVSQGCRPIGRHFVVTKAEQNVIYALGGRPPYAVINEMLQECPEADRDLARERGLLIGRVINEYQENFARGDFLVRSPIAFDAKTGALAVNDLVRTGQTVQFHVRDGQSASDDLHALLAPHDGAPTAGALLFSCNGRGTRLFSDRNHDSRAVQAAGRGAPLAGFFCMGEIGMIGQRNFLHGHTASVAIFRPTDAESHE